MAGSGDAWHGRQPKYEKPIMRDANHFSLESKLPSSQLVVGRLGRLPHEMPLPPGPELRKPLGLRHGACG
jgi:hypothetical protein